MLIVGNCFRSFGREFQWVGAMYLSDLWSEVLTTKLLWDPRVQCEWSILQVKDAILAGSILLLCLKEKHLTLCLKRSSIFKEQARAKRGSACERR